MGDRVRSGRLCACGCGEETYLAVSTAKSAGKIKGKPLRFLPHHNSRGSRSLEVKFWAKVRRRGPDQCWTWKAATVTNKHSRTGILSVVSSDLFPGQTMASARKVSLRIHGVAVARDDVVRTTCGNDLCVNPGHLYAVPKDEAFVGEANDNCKVTDAQVRVIRRRFRRESERRTNAEELAREYGITGNQVLAIAHGKSRRTA